MKKCLITGAAGNIGEKLIKELLNVGKYEITAFDLKSPKALKVFDNYKNKINIVYGDLNDNIIMKALIKDHDIIFHLAGIIPPDAELNANLIDMIDYKGSKNIVDLIREYNPNAYLIYPSTTSVYGNSQKVSLKSDINIYNNDYYSQNKYKVERYIEKSLKNYTIYRIPLIIDKNNFNTFMYNIPRNAKVEVITNDLVGIALAKSLDFKRRLNKKTFILSGGKNYRTTTNELLHNILSIQGISLRFLIMTYIIPQNFYTHYYEDSEVLNNIIDFQKGSIKDIYKNYKHLKKFKRCLHRFFAYYFLRKLSK